MVIIFLFTFFLRQDYFIIIIFNIRNKDNKYQACLFDEIFTIRIQRSHIL